MVTEQLCEAIVASMYRRSCTATSTMLPGTPDQKVTTVAHDHAVSRQDLYDNLLLKFDIREIDDAISWLKVRGYIGAFGFGLAVPEMGYELTPKGISYGESHKMSQEDLARLSSTAISVKPEIYGISLNPKELWWRIRKWFRSRRA